MTYGGTTYGGAATGSTSISVTELQLPGRPLQTVRGPDETTTAGKGGYGGATLGGGALGSAETEVTPVPTITVTGAGTATADAPGRLLRTTRTTPSLAYGVNAPARTLALDRAVPEATGAGTATADAPSRTLRTTRDVPRIGFVNWVLDGAEVPGVFDEVATHDTLTLAFRVQTDTLTDILRPLKTDQGQVAKLTTDSGGFVAVDRANGNNTFDLIPPVERKPLRQEGNVHVEGYEEDLVSQEVNEWNVELNFMESANRTDVPSIDETPDSGEWAFDTRYGQIATQRVDAEFLGTGSDGVPRFELVARLTFEQAHVFEAALAKVDGQRVRRIPDGDNVAVDETGGDVTVDVTSPTPDVVTSGDYTVTEWESERISDAYQELSLQIAETG